MALPNDMSRIADGIAKPEAAVPTYDHDQGSVGPARNLIRRSYVLRKPAADGAAATATVYTAADQRRMARPGRILGAFIQPQAALVANAADFATVSVQKADGLGGAGTTMASAATTLVGTGNWVAGASESLALSATIANTRYPAGAVLGFAIAKSGAGVVVDICSITVDVEEEGTDSYATG